MPEGYPFYQALKVLCEGGGVEFTFHAASTGVEAGAASGTSLLVYEPDQDPRLVLGCDGDAYEDEIATFVGAFRVGAPPSTAPPSREGRLSEWPRPRVGRWRRTKSWCYRNWKR